MPWLARNWARGFRGLRDRSADMECEAACRSPPTPEQIAEAQSIEAEIAALRTPDGIRARQGKRRCLILVRIVSVLAGVVCGYAVRRGRCSTPVHPIVSVAEFCLSASGETVVISNDAPNIQKDGFLVVPLHIRIAGGK